MKRAILLGASGFMLLGLSGCPVTDNYFIDAGQPLSGSNSGGTSGTGTGGGGNEALAQGGGKAQAGATGGKAQAGATGADGGSLAAGTGGGAPCMMPATERCNGHDDNCNDVVDELACDTSLGCTGFTLSTNLNHGYMFCSSHENWMAARDACAAQDMRLAALESADENTEIAKKLAALTSDVDVIIGANDQAMEGTWVWDGGAPFWKGNQLGKAVNGAFEAWASASPDDYQGNEDCGVTNPMTAAWADRSCAGIHAYLCEDKTPKVGP